MLRFAQIALTSVSALFLAVVCLNNVVDYGSNLAFVQHVLAMDTTFEGNALMGRAITAPWVHHAFYASIILWEAAAAILIGLGCVRLWRARGESMAEFQRAKTLAACGLVLSLMQWYLAFLVVGGEWFAMWQSRVWNGQEAAARMFMVMGISLLFLLHRDETSSPT